MLPTTESTSEEIVAYLQEKGVDVNPNAKKEDLLTQVASLTLSSPLEETKVKKTNPSSDMNKLMDLMSTMVGKLDKLDKRMTSVETSGKGDFKLSVKESDVISATESKKNVDERIIKIVEDILGVDFGVEIKPNPNTPGFQFSVLVPERLSEVKRSTRPVMDLATGEYAIDPKTKRVIEEEYWPGDRRSRAIGSTDSFDVIRDQCNRIRSYIISYYDKNKMPVPDFRLK